MSDFGIILDSDRDRRTLEWLRTMSSDADIQAAAQAVAVSGSRVYVSNVTKRLGLAEAAKAAQLGSKEAANSSRNLDRFKRPKAQTQKPPLSVSPADRVSAREMNPTGYLQSRGYEVKKDGVRHLSVRAHGDEVYRLTKHSEGHWLWCDRYGNSGGDNISLVSEIEPGMGYPDLVSSLLGALSAAPALPPEPVRTPPTLPVQTLPSRDQGRAYLMQRGISLEAIEYAETARVLAYCPGAVLFVGRDAAGGVQNATRRSVDPDYAVQKRDLNGSDKRYPPILQGDPAVVWIVEGGADALALYDLMRRAGRPVPTIIVSSGVNVLAFFQTQHVQDLIRRAERVVLAREIEKNEDARERAGAGSAKQAEQVALLRAECTGDVDVTLWWPQPGQGKDLAEVNLWQLHEQDLKKTERQDSAWHG